MTRSAILAGLALSTGLLVRSAAAEAQVGLRIVVDHAGPRYDHQRGYGYGYGYDGAYRFGYTRGYADGFDHGKDDAEDRDGFSFWHDKEYRNADHGYRGHYGSRWDYQRGYRSGYEAAYRRAYTHFQYRHDHSRCDSRYWTRELPRGYDRDGRYDDDHDRYRERRDPYDRDYR